MTIGNMVRPVTADSYLAPTAFQDSFQWPSTPTSQNTWFPALYWVTVFGRAPLALFWASLYRFCGEPLLWQLSCLLSNLSGLLSPDSYPVHNVGQPRPQALLLSLDSKSSADTDFFFRLSFCNNLSYLCCFPRLTAWLGGTVALQLGFRMQNRNNGTQSFSPLGFRKHWPNWVVGDLLYARLRGKPWLLAKMSGTLSLKPISWCPKHRCSCRWCVSLSFGDTRARRRAVLPWFFFPQLPVFSLEGCHLPLSEKKIDVFSGQSICSSSHYFWSFLAILPPFSVALSPPQ